MVLSKKCAKFDYGYFQNLVRYYQVQELFFALSVPLLSCNIYDTDFSSENLDTATKLTRRGCKSSSLTSNPFQTVDLDCSFYAQRYFLSNLAATCVDLFFYESRRIVSFHETLVTEL